MGFDEVAREGEAKAGAMALGRIERQQGLREHRLAHARAAVEDVDAPLLGQAAQHQLHLVGG